MDRRSADSPASPLDGVLAIGAGVALGELTAALVDGRSPLTALAKGSIDLTPGPVVDAVVATAEHHDKTLLMASLLAEAAALSGLAARARSLAVAAGVPAAYGVAAAAAGASQPESPTARSLLTGVAHATGAAGSIAALRRSPDLRLPIAAAATAAGALATVRRRARRSRHQRRRAASVLPAPALAARPIDPGTSLAAPGISPLFTPNRDFYVTDVQVPPTRVDPDRWRLGIGGMVSEPLELSLEDLLAMELVELDATLVCVHNPPGGPRIGSARWLGVPLADLLERAGVTAGAEQLLARAVDGFTAGVPLERIRSGAPALLALAMNGEPLPPLHGYPARLLVPGLWGADANTKWVSELELTTWSAASDYWDRRGWPRQPTAVKPGARIDLPANRASIAAGEAVAGGVAWAPPAGVERVEVSIDGGSWEPAELGAEQAPTMWRQWRVRWPAQPGAHTIAVRTVGREATQSAQPAPPYPVGASGYHSVRVEVATAAGGASPRRRALRPLLAAADDGRGRLALARRGVGAWRSRGFPPSPQWPPPS